MTLSNAKTKLEKKVQTILNSHARDSATGINGILNDLFCSGCQSGTIGELIYFSDTLNFYEKYHDEIDQLLQDILEFCGVTPSELFKHCGWDDSDPLARGDINKNILAWFGFEETARSLANKAGLQY